MSENDFGQKVDATLKKIGDMLKEKNKSYGNAALQPLRVFSRMDQTEQLKVRIDDKLSRISRGKDFGQEDTVFDLAGYLVLYMIASEEKDEK